MLRVVLCTPLPKSFAPRARIVVLLPDRSLIAMQDLPHLPVVAVTVLPSTFYGLAVLFMVCVCGILLNPPAVPLESSGKVMEMGEHSPSRGKSAKLPIVLCERPLSHLGAWLAYGAVWWEWAVRSGGLQ
jgi:hypothetical protein